MPKPKSKKGLFIIYEGNGKGKTTAAMGLAARALGTGFNVCIIQFVKGDWVSGEKYLFDACKKLRTNSKHKIGKVDFIIGGKGFVKILGDKKPFQTHQRAAKDTLSLSRKAMMSKKYDVVILDEAISAIEEKLLTIKDLLSLVKIKPTELHLVMTGHYTPKSLIAKADLVSNIKMIKHPYYKGILAQKGIDF